MESSEDEHDDAKSEVSNTTSIVSATKANKKKKGICLLLLTSLTANKKPKCHAMG